MNEDFVVFLWKHRKLRGNPLRTVCGKDVEIISPGQENHNSGPDFLSAMVRIDHTLWAGNVEIHVRSSQWFAHNHHKDKAYDNIILHVVYEFDREITSSSRNIIQHLEVKHYFDHALLENYTQLERSKTWIACAKLIGQIDPYLIKHWIWRLLVSRIERKTEEMNHYLNYFNADREKTFLFMLCRVLAGKANETAFGLLVQRLDRLILEKNHNQLFILEALLFGQAGLLEESFMEDYPKSLQVEYQYQRKKHDLPPPLRKQIWKYSRMRPGNFPDLRIAQLAMLICNNGGIRFRQIIQSHRAEEIGCFFRIQPSAYWSSHYRLDHPVSPKSGTIGEETINRLLINTIAPAIAIDRTEKNGTHAFEGAISLLEQLPPENNKIIRQWQRLLSQLESAAETQGLLELYKYYCTPKKCLKCMIGNKILSSNSSFRN